MIKYLIIIHLIFFSISTAISAEFAPEIYQIEELMISIKLNRGDILFPDKFQSYRDNFDRIKAINMERQLTQVEKADLAQLNKMMGEILEDTEYLKPNFNSILEVREEALFNFANDYAPGLFQTAEGKLQELAVEFLNRMPSEVDKRIAETALLYRQAQFEALRNKLLSEVRILIEESKDLDAEKLVPQTYDKVMILALDVESIIREKKYEDNSLHSKANELLQESQHLLHLVQVVQRVKRDPATLEGYLIKMEESLGKLGMLVKLEPQFANGIPDYLETFEIALQELTNDNEDLKNRNIILSDSLAKLQTEIQQLKNEMNRNKDFTNKVENLRVSLSSYGIKVIENHNHITFRLNGVEFPPGKTQVDATGHSKLKKIAEAIRIFPSTQILIRLGQSSSGNLQYNKSMAEQRAKAVALIVQSEGFIKDERIRSEGIILENELNTGHAIIDVIVEVPNL